VAQLLNLPYDVVLWGEGTLAAEIPTLPQRGVERPIVFSVDFLDAMRREHIHPYLKDSVGTFVDLPPHVLDTAVAAGLDAVRTSGAKSIVAHGGGSVLDAAKAVSHLHQQQTGEFLPIAALPTTLSGSEFSHYFGITETDGPQRFKRSYAVRETTPKVVILDPLLLKDTPRQLLLSSAIKGIDHAVEGMRMVSVEHPHAIMAASGVQRFLSVLSRWPADIEANEALRQGLVAPADLLSMQLAAWHCYFAPASVIYGLSHRIGHILGGTFGLPHSVTSCITLAPVIRACADFYGPKLTNFVEGPVATAGERLAQQIEDAVIAAGLPRRIGDFGLDRNTLPEISGLLKNAYPVEVADLGSDADVKLDRLLESLW
jgi:alcohol dehydrogenase class IV